MSTSLSRRSLAGDGPCSKILTVRLWIGRFAPRALAFPPAQRYNVLSDKLGFEFGDFVLQSSIGFLESRIGRLDLKNHLLPVDVFEFGFGPDLADRLDLVSCLADTGCDCSAYRLCPTQYLSVHSIQPTALHGL